MTKQLNKDSLYKVLKRNFHELSLESITDLIDDGELMYLDSEKEIIKQGDVTKDVYFLLFGRIIATIENKYGESILLNEISQGEFFGEMSLLSGDLRAATLTTIKESILLKVSGENFERHLDKHPLTLRYINKILIKRLQKSNLSNNDTVFQNICCVQLGKLQETLQSIVLLKEKLFRTPKVCIVTKEGALNNNLLQVEDDIADRQYKFINWVHDLSSQFDFIIYFCDEQDLEWSELCIRQADRIMLFGAKDLSTNLTPLESNIFLNKNIAAKIEKNLVVSWSQNEVISGTERMLQNRHIKNVFHIISEKEIDRLIRYFQGRSIKLVLSGGGARGFAHLGVYKALVELDIPVDFVGGTSAGSLMAGAMAMGWSYNTAKVNSYQALVKNNPLNDYHFPLVSFLKGKRFRNTLDKHFGNTQVEDLISPFYAVASNFTKSKIEILNRGSLVFAINASMALPAILPPMVKGNSLLMDGGLMDNLPFEYMNSLAHGTNIGVDLSTSKKRDLGFDKIPSNLTLLKQKLFGKIKYKVPNISQIMMGTLTLASEEKVRNNEKKFDLYIKPDVSGFGFLEWNNFDALIKCGYDTAYPILKKWKEEQEI
jgi:NTE family protein